MKVVHHKPFFLGSIFVEPEKSTIRNCNQTHSLQPKQMAVLVYLVKNAGQLVTTEELIENCWPNQVISDSPVTKTIAQIRKLLDDSIKESKYIKTVSKKGYVVVAEITGVTSVQEQAHSVWTNDVPFLGKNALQEHHEPIFFGRNHSLTAALTKLDTKEHLKFLIVTGLPFVGKSSFINAGLIPKLKRLHVAQAGREAKITILDGKDVSTSTFKTSILKTPLHLNSTDILVVDHLDHWLTNTTNSPLLPVLEQITDLGIRYKLTVIFSIGSLFLERFLEFIKTNGFDQIFRSQNLLTLPAFTKFELTEILQKTCSAAKIEFESSAHSANSLAATIVEDCFESNNPTLIYQEVLLRLFEACPRHTLNHGAYMELGSAAGCWNTLAKECYSTLSTENKSNFELILFQLVEIQSLLLPTPTTRQVKWSSLNAELTQLAWTLIDGGIVSVQANEQQLEQLHGKLNTEEFTITLSDASLLSSFEPIITWLDRNLSKLYLRQDIEVATKRWLSRGKNSDYLFSSKQPIEGAIELRHSESYCLTRDEHDFIDASLQIYRKNSLIKRSIVAGLAISLVSLIFMVVTLQLTTQEIEKNRHDAENLISFIVSDLKDKLEPIGQLDLLHLIGTQTTEYFDRAGTDSLSDKSTIQLADALNILGEVSVKKNEFNDARSYFSKSLQALSQVNRRSHHYESATEKSMYANFWLGYMDYEEQNLSSAIDYFSDYHEKANMLLSIDRHNPTWLLEKSYALNNLGSLFFKKRELEAAGEFFRQSREIKSKLIDLEPDNLTYRDEYSDTLSWIASVLEAQGNYSQASKLYDEAYSMMLVVSNQAPDNHVWLSNLVVVELRLAQSLFESGKNNEAKALIINSKLRLERLYQRDPDNALIVRRDIFASLFLARIERLAGEFDQSMIVLQQAIDMHAKLVSLSTQPNLTLEKEIEILTEHGLLLIVMQQHRSGHRLLNKAIGLAKSYDRQNKSLLERLAFLLVTKSIYRDESKLQQRDINNLSTGVIEDLNYWIDMQKGSRSIELLSSMLRAIHPSTNVASKHTETLNRIHSSSSTQLNDTLTNNSMFSDPKFRHLYPEFESYFNPKLIGHSP